VSLRVGKINSCRDSITFRQVWSYLASANGLMLDALFYGEFEDRNTFSEGSMQLGA
jgi:hypothetical protein